MRPPRLPTQILVRSGSLFGIAEGTTRVALSRMVAAGELEPDGDGYRLGGPLLIRQVRQDLSRHGTGATGDDPDEWTLQVVTGEARDPQERARLRSAATALRLAELREGVWTRPANLPAGVLPADEAIVAAQCRGFRSTPDGDPARLAAALWDLDGWAARAIELRRRLGAVVGALTAGDLEALPEGFVLSAATLRHFQADPLLPDRLLPARWPGAALRADYEEYDAAFKTVWRAWYRDQVRAISGGARSGRP
jgi:phenylacetic acid degradation operon negative regulatory protein